MKLKELPLWFLTIILIAIVVGFGYYVILPAYTQSTDPVALKTIKGTGLETFEDWMNVIYPSFVLTIIISAMVCIFISPEKKKEQSKSQTKKSAN